MMTGRSEPQYAGLVVVGIAVVIALTYGLAAKFSGRNFALKIGLMVAALWTAVVAAIVLLRAGAIISPFFVAAFFVPATAWLASSACMYFTPIRWTTSLGVLAALLALIAPFVMIFRIDGLTGGAPVISTIATPRQAKGKTGRTRSPPEVSI
jgi:hypothetical protein